MSHQAVQEIPQRQKRQAVLVLGMHRSGTSIITRAISSLGAQLPLRLLPPMADNPHGFFEPNEIVMIHERLLTAAGTSWFDWNLFPQSWSESQEAESIVADLIAAVRTDYGDAGLFVLKDPRICRFAPIWMRIFSELDLTPFVVLPFRNPIEVAKSLRVRNDFPLPHGYLLWLRHVLDAELTSRDFPRIFLRYEDFVDDGRRQIDRLASDLPLGWPRQSAEAYRDIESWIDASLRHHPATHEDMIDRNDIFQWLRDTYEAYEKLCVDPLDRGAQQTLDRVYLAFNTACDAFAPAFRQQSEAHLKRISGLEIDLGANQKRAEALQADAARIPLLERELRDLRQRSMELKSRAALIPELQMKLAATYQQTKQLEHEIARISDLETMLQAAKAEARRAISLAEARDRQVAESTGRIGLMQSEMQDLLKDDFQSENALKRGLKHAYWALTLQLPERVKSEQRLKERMRIAALSGYFDSQWYLANYPDVAVSGWAPLRHFCECGFSEGRYPGPLEASRSALQALLEGR